jgi:polyisoprenyl-teichoic acid--peptidoglycan teichoic acid transferase
MKYTDISKQKRMAIYEPRNRGFSRFALLAIILLLIGSVLYIFRGKIRQAFNPVSIIANVSAANLLETDGRTNILVLGSDKRDAGAESGRVLTDTMMIISIGTVDNDIVMVSLPRDLWISNYSCTTDICNGAMYESTKLNAVYEFGGPNEVRKVVQDVTGIPIHYYALVDFNLFEQAITTLGGVNVDVKTAFTDNYYPIEGKENDTCGKSKEEINKTIEEIAKGTTSTELSFPCRFKTISFQTGVQSMDATTALEFSRSRHASGSEGTDFARAKRQQEVILAIKNKALSMQTLFNPVKLKGLYDAYSKNVDTNMDLKTLESFYLLSQQINFDKAVSIVLDDSTEADKGGLLYNPVDTTLYGGAWVLIPRSGDFSQVHAYMQKYIFGEKQ